MTHNSFSLRNSQGCHRSVKKKSSQNCQFWGLFSSLFHSYSKSGQANKQWLSESKKARRTKERGLRWQRKIDILTFIYFIHPNFMPKIKEIICWEVSFKPYLISLYKDFSRKKYANLEIWLETGFFWWKFDFFGSDVIHGSFGTGKSTPPFTYFTFSF